MCKHMSVAVSCLCLRPGLGLCQSLGTYECVGVSTLYADMVMPLVYFVYVLYVSVHVHMLRPLVVSRQGSGVDTQTRTPKP